MEENKLYLNTAFEFIENESQEGEAFSAVSLNPQFQWAKIVVTDDLKNANKQRIPEDEFSNLIKTGTHSPIKMARGEISRGHDEAFGNPLGVIANLAKETNKVIALAALWKRERPDDVNKLKEMYTNGTPPNVSWEISYTESEVDTEGVETLKGVALNGLAIVGMPAYEGRTSFVAMAAKDTEGDDSNKEKEKLDELELLKQELADLKTKFEEKQNELNTKQAELDSLQTELAEYKDYKDTIERSKAEAEKLQAIKTRFVEAGIEKDENYFTEKSEFLLKLDDEELNFMIQEMVAFKESIASDQSDKKPKVPDIKNLDKDNIDLSNPKDLAKELRALKAKK
jgi:hypothetical protein